VSEQDSSGEQQLRPGEFAFTLFMTVVAVLLLSLITEETRFYKRLKLPTQPGFWPAIGLGGMVLCGVVLSISGWMKNRRSGSSQSEMNEIAFISRAGEFMLWFMVYVWITPWTGYLFSTLIFMTCLSWRAGYRSGKMQLVAAGLAIGIVVLFKSFLSVKIPSGAVYDLLPPALQSFMATNL